MFELVWGTVVGVLVGYATILLLANQRFSRAVREFFYGLPQPHSNDPTILEWVTGIGLPESQDGEHEIGTVVAIWVFSITQALAMAVNLIGTVPESERHADPIDGYKIHFPLNTPATTQAEERTAFWKTFGTHFGLTIATTGMVLGMFRSRRVRSSLVKLTYDSATRTILGWVFVTIWIAFLGVSASGYFQILPRQVDITSRYALPRDVKLDGEGGFRLATPCVIQPPPPAVRTEVPNATPAITFYLHVGRPIRDQWRVAKIDGYKITRVGKEPLSDFQYADSTPKSATSGGLNEPRQERPEMDADFFQLTRSDVEKGGEFEFVYHFTPRAKEKPPDPDSASYELSKDAQLLQIVTKKSAP